MPMVTETMKQEQVFNEQQLSTIKSHVAEIKVLWNKSRDGIVELGKRLKTAKYDKTVTTHMFSQICTDCGFTPKNADKLIKISESPRIISGQYNNILPISYGTLYEIATLKDKEFEDAVKKKVIHPDCFRKDIENLKKNVSNKKKKEHKENFKLMSVFIDNEDMDSRDEYLKFRNAVEKSLKKVDGIRLDFSSLENFLTALEKKQKKNAVKNLVKSLKTKIDEQVLLDPHLCKIISSKRKHEKELSIVLKKDLYGDSTKIVEQLPHYANTLKEKWKVDWRQYTVSTAIYQKPVGEIPELDVEKIAA